MRFRQSVPVALLATLLVSAAVGAQGEAPPLSLSQAVAEGMRSHPLVRAAEQRLVGSAAHLRGARAPLNPEVTVQHGVGNGTGGLDEDLAISQVFELGGKRRFRGEEAEGERRKAAAELDAARLEVAYQVQAAYLALQEATAVRDQTLQFLRLAEQFRTTAQAQFAAGEVPRTQVIRSEIEVSARQQTLDEADAERKSRLSTLNSLLGRPLEQPTLLAGELPEPPAEGSLENWRTLAAARPEVQAARAELQARQAGVRVAHSAFAPNLFAAGVHARLDQWPGNSVRVGVSLPLLDRGSLRAQREEAKATVAATEAQLAETLRGVELEIRIAYDQAMQAGARLRRYRSGQLDQARTLAELAQIGYETGHSSFLELLDAQRLYHETRSGYLRVLAEAARAHLSLERAAGSPHLLTPGPEGKQP